MLSNTITFGNRLVNYLQLKTNPKPVLIFILGYVIGKIAPNLTVTHVEYGVYLFLLCVTLIVLWGIGLGSTGEHFYCFRFIILKF